MTRPRNSNVNRISRFGLTLSLMLSLFGLSDAHASTCAPATTINGSYTFVTFTSVATCNYEMPSGVSSIDLLVVGGGGGGGYNGGGGGGGGGVVIKSSYSVSSGTQYSITVGGGGTAGTGNNSNGVNGNTSAFDVINALGGGGGGSVLNASGNSGASGGGGGAQGTSGTAPYSATGGSGTYATDGDATTYGNSGGLGRIIQTDSPSTYAAGGGGGAGAVGSDGASLHAGSGGSGQSWSVNSTAYGGGGAGGQYNGSGTSLGGSGGGGNSGTSSVNATAGTANTGGGGGGGGSGTHALGSSGGSGIVIIRFVTPSNPISISQQPGSANPTLGGNVTLTTVASATDGGTLGYQWYVQSNLNDTRTAISDSGTAISGSQSNQLILTNVTATSTGLYSVRITDTYNGSTTFLWSNVSVVYISLASETFQGASFVTPGNWVAAYHSMGSGYTAIAPCLTANSSSADTTTSTSPVSEDVSSIKGCKYFNVDGETNTVVDSVTAGALRLTSAVRGTSSALIYNVAQATTQGLDISFYASQWGANHIVGTQADGMTFFLKDGTDNSTASGQGGGSLGYSGTSSVDGVPNGLFGIGLDAYGNYSNSAFGGTGCLSGASNAIGTYSSVITRNGTAKTETENQYTSANAAPNTPNGVVIRGPQGSDTKHGYCIISPTTSTGQAAVTSTLGSNSYTTRSSGVHYFRVLIDPSTSASPTMTLFIDGTNVISIPTPKAYADSPTFKFGFTGSTGGADENIDIYSTAINTYTGVTAPDAPTSVSYSSSSAGAGTVSWSHDSQWGQGEAASGTRTFTATLYDSTGTTSQGISCSTTATSGSPTTSCSLTGLSSGTYVIKVNATNYSGLTSTDSSASASFTISNQGLTWTIKTATNSVYSNYNGTCTSNCAYTQQVYSDSTGNWVVLKFTNTSVVSDTSTVSLVDGVGTFTVPAKVTSFTYLIVGGGGGGGYDAGGGGGGGGIETGTVSGLSRGDLFTISVGSGGLGGGACHNNLSSYNGNFTNGASSGNGNCDASSNPNGHAYYSDGCSYTDTGGTNYNDASLGQNGMNGDSSTLVGPHSTSLSAYGGGGGGGRCQRGNSSGNIANSGGAGEKCFATNGYNTSNVKTSTSCTNTSPGTQANATYYIGGGASYFTGGGGGGYGSKGGTFGQDSFCGTYPNVYTCSTGTRTNVYSILSSEGGAGSALFSGSPMAGTYGGGGGGGTYCSTSHTCNPAGGGIFPEGQPCITSCGTTALTYPAGFSGGIFGTGQIYALGGGSGGSGGVGDGFSTSIPNANSGGGGGGGGGWANAALVGAHGANGIVFIKYQLPITTSGTTISVNRNAAAGGTLSSGGTVLLEYAALTDTTPSCSTSYTVYSNISVTNAVDYTFSVIDGDSSLIDNTHLVRGYCYRWTQDPSLGNGELGFAAPPTDSNGVAFGNLTSPVIMIPNRVGLKYPKIVVVDPRTSSVSLPGMAKTLSGAGDPQFCFYEVSTNSSSATPMSTTITFTGSQITGTHLTNLPNGIQFYDVLAQAEKDLTSLRLTSSSTRYFHATRYVLIKTVPYMPSFNSDCTGANTGDLNTTSNDAYVITIKPLVLTRTVAKDIQVHH